MPQPGWDVPNDYYDPDDKEPGSCKRCDGESRIHWLKLHAHGPELDTDDDGNVECPRCGGTGNEPRR